jgi:UDP-glucose 4-epimerase
MPDEGFSETQSDPTTVYSTTKACLALLAESYQRTKGLNYTALRYFNVAGPLQDYNRTIPPVFAGFILRIKGGHNPIVFGDYMKARDYIDVSDVNAFHILCMENEDTANQTFNLGTGKMTNLMELKNMIGDIMGVGEIPFDHYDPIAGEALNIRGDISKAKSMGWEPKKDIKDTIKETIVYLENEISEGTIDPLTFMEDLEIEKVKI